MKLNRENNYAICKAKDVIINVTVLALFTISLVGNFILTNRLERNMAELKQYRTECRAAQNREYEIGECISRTAEILNETSYSVADLREKLKEVENSYNYMWELLNNRNYTHYNDEEIINREEK